MKNLRLAGTHLIIIFFQPSLFRNQLDFCRYCSKTSNNDNLMMHRIYKRRWYNRRPFAARVRILNAATGVINYLTRTFSNKNGPIILSEMLETHNTKYR